MRNLKISKKLAISYGVVLTLLVLSMIVSIFNLTNIGAKVETFYNGPFLVKGSANIINTKFEQMQKSVYRAISNSDMTITNEAIDNAKMASETIQAQMPIVKEHFLGDQKIIDELQSHLTELAPMRETVLELASQNKNEEAAAYMEKTTFQSLKKLRKSSIS